MAEAVLLTQTEFIWWSLGWAFSPVLGVLLGLILWRTPAKVFLKAFVTRKPVCFVHYRSGNGGFLLGKPDQTGGMDVKGVGYVITTEGSHILEATSKVPVYSVFSEYAATIPKEYAPIIQAMREQGYKIQNFGDYKHLFELANNKEYAEKFLAKTKPEDKNAVEELIKKVRGEKIELKPYKSYKMQDLSYMFPNNISPIYVDMKVTNAINEKLKRAGKDYKNVLTIVTVAIILLVGLAIVYKIVASGNTTTIVQAASAGVQSVANANTGTITA